jgi:hypothetical protein
VQNPPRNFSQLKAFEFPFVEGGLYEYPVWVSAPQAHSRVSNINFDILTFFFEKRSL